MMELKDIKGAGTKTIEYLNKLNINTIEDLISNYPYRYEIIKPIDIKNVVEEQTITIIGKVISIPKVIYYKENLNRLSFVIDSNSKIINVSIFNRRFMKDSLDMNKVVTITGKYTVAINQFVANDIKLFNIGDSLIVPYYHLVHGLKKANIIKLIDRALKMEDEIIDYIPAKISKAYQFISKPLALKKIHKPITADDIKQAKVRLIYEELFVFITKVNYMRTINNVDNGIKRVVKKSDILNFIDTLPFHLTADQLEAINEIYEDLTSPKRMNRLLLGDVGSGKTIVAFIAMYINYLAGYQSALMVPTEILATQHYNNILKLLPANINVALFTSKITNDKKKKIINDLKNNKIDIVIGTHAILNDAIIFNNLSLVITDEQHRFGVNQRSNFNNKGIKPDVLYLSATPIPRTYALTIYGDMLTSIIKTKPGNKKEVITTILDEANIKNVLTVINKELLSNHQIYVVAPSIFNNEDEEINDVFLLKDKYQKAFPNATIGLMHGKLKSEEKDSIINSFVNGDINILISTTVIEVGIDVSKATVMVVYNGERFGLATLHQLRGRVGRGNDQSYCFIISKEKKERLEVLEKSNDGFYIAEMDFKLRGEGDILGTMQHGDMTFKIANLRRDYKILEQAKIDSEKLMKLDDPIVNKIINNMDLNN